ncbi:unnamed protein product, partial [Callosobruchus maculatus]
MVYGWSIHSELWHPYHNSDKTKQSLQSCTTVQYLRVLDLLSRRRCRKKGY